MEGFVVFEPDTLILCIQFRDLADYIKLRTKKYRLLPTLTVHYGDNQHIFKINKEEPMKGQVP